MEPESDDPFDLQRFLDAQDPVFGKVLWELERGRKTSHWMWFVFPQIIGLGESSVSRHYAIASREEARSYLLHPILGQRLRDCTRLVVRVTDRSAIDIFGPVDAMKFRSSMTLFAGVAEDKADFDQALSKYFDGQPDPVTKAWL